MLTWLVTVTNLHALMTANETYPQRLPLDGATHREFKQTAVSVGKSLVNATKEAAQDWIAKQKKGARRAKLS